jgi:hypothetical protein
MDEPAVKQWKTTAVTALQPGAVWISFVSKDDEPFSLAAVALLTQVCEETGKERVALGVLSPWSGTVEPVDATRPVWQHGSISIYTPPEGNPRRRIWKGRMERR